GDLRGAGARGPQRDGAVRLAAHHLDHVTGLERGQRAEAGVRLAVSHPVRGSQRRLLGLDRGIVFGGLGAGKQGERTKDQQGRGGLLHSLRFLLGAFVVEATRFSRFRAVRDSRRGTASRSVDGGGSGWSTPSSAPRCGVRRAMEKQGPDFSCRCRPGPHDSLTHARGGRATESELQAAEPLRYQPNEVGPEKMFSTPKKAPTSRWLWRTQSGSALGGDGLK